MWQSGHNVRRRTTKSFSSLTEFHEKKTKHLHVKTLVDDGVVPSAKACTTRMKKEKKNELLFDSLDRMVFRSEKIVFVSMMANLTKLWFLIKGSFDMQHRKGTSLKLFYASGSMKYNFLGVIWHFLWSLFQFNSYLILTISVILEKKTKKKVVWLSVSCFFRKKWDSESTFKMYFQKPSFL